MAEGDGTIYNEFKYQVLNALHNLANGQDTIKVALVTGHSPDIDADTGFADVVADEESGTGYSASGETLANQATSKDTTDDEGVFDGDNVTWSGLDVGTPSHAIMYNDTATGDSLMAYWELTTASNGGDYTLQWDTEGIINIG